MIHPPIQAPFFLGEAKRISDVWVRWLNSVKIAENEAVKAPHRTSAVDSTIITTDLGKTVLFSIGANDRVCTLILSTGLSTYSLVTIARIGTGKLTINASGADAIESDVAYFTDDNTRLYCSITLQLISAGQWAIFDSVGVWEVVV
jgi:hypothetical protein